VENVMSAPESELREVGKIGKKKASELRKLLSTRYMPANAKSGDTRGENSA